jgi:hypothetical protein
MFHPIPPGLSGTDGNQNVHENASRLPDQKRGISNSENTDTQVCVPRVPIARRFSDEDPQGLPQRRRSPETVQQFDLAQCSN